ncbi:general transcription factor II-I repeat domain-containing protein 2-like [Hyla sarda]|uniref:general transcription factor II-I repeat domain-containing protein 2-like n=1 Tax=Hyla sarda TaxID=327740 RepID=UPI0024C24AB8|nr:general transcription factor II-I repeat domain-containing protein 2-like [Hyla sarda]
MKLSVFSMSSSKPSGSKSKRKIAEEHRNFQEKWEFKFFCCEVSDKIICLICNDAISVPKLYNIKRHYEQHKTKNDNYEGLMRQEKLKQLKLGLKKQQFMFTKVSQESEAAVHANYVLSGLIAKHSKTFTKGYFIKECLIKAAEIVCPGSVKAFQVISLSRNTVVERVTDLAANLCDQLKSKSSSFKAFSIACDESTDIGGVAQLAVFLRACDTDFNIFEELLELVPRRGTTTGKDIFICVDEVLQKYNLPLSKLNSVATDGAPSMTGKTNGFVE